jgi:hypothetical protein
MLDVVAEALFSHGWPYWLALATGYVLTISLFLAMTSVGSIAAVFRQCREQEG